MPDPRPEIPIDPDLGDPAPDEVDRQVHDEGAGHPAPRPLYLRPGFLLMVGVGGAAGTATRALLTQFAGTEFVLGTAPATLIINVSGCLFLGVLLELLFRIGHDVGVRRVLRLLLGTGFLGGYTTYSTLALEVAEGVRAGRWSASIGYALASLLLGLLASTVGVALASLRRHHAAGQPEAGH